MSAAQAAMEVGPITFGPDSFKVKGRILGYQQVMALSWYWYSQTVNFLNTQDARLSIHVVGTNEEIKIAKTTMYVSPKLAEAYRILRERTWDYRITKYVEPLAKQGFFRYQGADFYTNGVIRSGGDEFSLSAASIEAFDLRVKLGGLFSRKLTLSLRYDHDIIHGLIGKFKHSPEDPEMYVWRLKTVQEEHQAEQHWFFDTIRLCAKIAMADGAVDPDEILVIKEFVRMAFNLDEEMLRRAITLFNEARESDQPARFYAHRLHKYHGRNPKLISAIFNLLRDVALADGELHGVEATLLEDVARVLGFDPRRRSSERAREHQEGARSDANGTAGDRGVGAEEKRHGGVLGLSGKVTVEMIRVAYRKLVIAHHPDKFHNSSDGERRRAHERMVEINAAYTFFREKYDF